MLGRVRHAVPALRGAATGLRARGDPSWLGWACASALAGACGASWALSTASAQAVAHSSHTLSHAPRVLANGLSEGRDFLAYDHQGKAISFDCVLTATLARSQGRPKVLFLGEFHDDPVAHALEHEVFKQAVSATAPKKPPHRRALALSLEMFERDVQAVMDEYLLGMVREADLLKDGRAWPNYHNDYRPMVELARADQVPVICANAPRRYVSLAGRSGREALQELPKRAFASLPPLPYASPSAAYVDKTNGIMAQAAAEMKAMKAEKDPESSSHTSEKKTGEGEGGGCPYIGFNVSTKFLDAQTLWDASMAYNIAEHLKGDPENLVVHVCGKFHVDGRLGIPEHLEGYAPNADMAVVSFIPCDLVKLQSGEHLHQVVPEAAFINTAGDFVVLTNDQIPRSFEVNHPV